MAERRRRIARPLDELFFVDLAGAEQTPRSPDDGAGPDQLAVVPSVQHRPAVQGYGGNIYRGSGHDRGRSRLVAAGSQHNGINRVAVQNFDQPKIRKVAVERRGWPAAILEDRVHREFHRNPTGVSDAGLDPFDQLQVHTVARHQVGARL